MPEFILYWGPQDGAKVKQVGEYMPQRIFVGAKWLGDGYAAWSREYCERFPCSYLMEGGKFVFRENHNA